MIILKSMFDKKLKDFMQRHISVVKQSTKKKKEEEKKRKRNSQYRVYTYIGVRVFTLHCANYFRIFEQVYSTSVRTTFSLYKVSID